MKSKKYIIPIILFLVGFASTILGVLFKIQHLQFASELLTFGMLFQVIAIVTLIFMLIKFYKQKE